LLAGLAGVILLAAGAAAPAPAPPGAAPAFARAFAPCVVPEAVATLAAWPAAAAGQAADEYEVRGERRPDALAVSAGFRAFQTCRQQRGG
jgi:hypothetical protein